MSFNRILVTGAEGFVGRHLVLALQAAFPGSEITGTARLPGDGEVLEITDPEQVRASFARLQPDACFHLAGIAAVGAARANPRQAWHINLHGTLNIADAILAETPQCRMIFISSAECYGASFKTGLPLTEDTILAPANLYAATKAAAELALGVLAGQGLRLLRLRPFNHTGPGQTEDFVAPAFAGQIARIEAGQIPPELAVGALNPERDFLDIRDVCSAYIAGLQNFDRLPNNQVFNIASGKAVEIGNILDILLAHSPVNVAVRQDPSRLRPVEIMRAVGDAGRAAELLGWQPRFTLEETLKTVLDFARQQIGGARFTK